MLPSLALGFLVGSLIVSLCALGVGAVRCVRGAGEVD